MAKQGGAYQELAADVAPALLPGATVEVGVWVDGPDGSREVDVAARGIVEGRDRFVLIECTDWKGPVDVQAIDALDSKRRDLGADYAVIMSNAGFSNRALRKAARVGIEATSVLAEGSPRAKPVLTRWITSRRLSVDRGNTFLTIQVTTELTGTFAGTQVAEEHAVVHPNGVVTVETFETFTGTVNGVAGTALFRTVGAADAASGALSGQFAVSGGTGGPAGLHGHGTIAGVGDAGTYAAEFHIDPAP